MNQTSLWMQSYFKRLILKSKYIKQIETIEHFLFENSRKKENMENALNKVLRLCENR